jgi:hypothetical protein
MASPVDNKNPSKDSLENYFSSSRDGIDIMNIKHDIESGFASIISANGEGRKTRPSLGLFIRVKIRRGLTNKSRTIRMNCQFVHK